MQGNILRDSEINKIYIIYTNANGIKKKENVTLRYMGDNECYFAAPISINFVRPKSKTPADIYVYTVDGVFNATVKIQDTTMQLNEIMFQCDLPKIWNFTQLRLGSRKVITLPGKLKFNDGESIMFNTYDLSVGGLSFLLDSAIPSIYQKFSCCCEIEFPKELLINFPNRTLLTEVKFARVADGYEEQYEKHFYALKFVKLSNDETMIIKNFLLGLT